MDLELDGGPEVRAGNSRCRHPMHQGMAIADGYWENQYHTEHLPASDLVPLLEDKKEAVRVRAAAGYLRLEAIKSAPVRSVRKPETKKRLPVPPSTAGKN